MFFRKRTAYDVYSSETLCRLIAVGVSKIAMTPEELESLMRGTFVNNQDYELNCQDWVQKTLERMATEGYLMSEEYEQGLDKPTMEAADEPKVL